MNTHHRWTLRGDAPEHHQVGCTTTDCCWSLLTLIPGGGQPNPADNNGQADTGGLSVWAGWCTQHGETEVTDTGACVACTGGDVA